LKERGHKLDEQSKFGACQAILFDADARTFSAAYDPRIPGKADGW
jgi:hypothetical protein